jgi:hypothetical protein
MPAFFHNLQRSEFLNIKCLDSVSWSREVSSKTVVTCSIQNNQLAIQGCAIICNTVLCYAMLCYIMLCNAMLCYVKLRFVYCCV